MSGVIIVTGGNRGIGLDVCKKLAASGRDVLLCARSQAAGRKAAAEVEQSAAGGKGSCTFVQLDTSSSTSIAAFVEQVGQQHDQRIAALINNAGIMPETWREEEDFRAAMRTNLTGPVDLALGLASHIAPGGRVIMVSSGLGQRHNLTPAYQQRVAAAASLEELQALPYDPAAESAFRPAYCISKAALNRATQLLAALPEFQGKGVFSVSPGWVRTDMGGSNAPGSVEDGTNKLLAALEFPLDQTGQYYLEGKPTPL